MSTIKITEEQLKRIANVKLINCDSFQGTIYKYMPLSRVLEMLREKKLTFVYPELWQDPYETKYLKTDYSSVCYTQNKIFCLCARMDNLNEEASWKIYKNNQEPLIKVYIKTANLFNYLKAFTERYGCRMYLSKINYEYSKAEINQLYKKEHPLYKEFFIDMDEEKYIKLMSLKRRAFNYENEMRLFIVPEKSDAPFDGDLLKVDIGFEIFARFTFEPCERIKDENNILSKLQIARYNGTKECAKAEIIKLFPKAKVFRSTLYSNTDIVSRIEK